MRAPAARRSSGVSPVTVARVPTVMKAGVSTAPCAVMSLPRRARVLPSCAVTWNESAMSGLRRSTEEDGVVRRSLGLAPAHGLHLDGIAGLAEALLEGGI